MEHRVTITIGDRGDQAAVERDSEHLLEALLAAAPDFGPATAGDFERGTVEATISFEADDAGDAAQRGQAVVDSAAAAAGLGPVRPVRIVALEVELAEEHAPEPA